MENEKNKVDELLQKAESLNIFTVESAKRSNAQRLIALRHAFQVIDAYAIPSLTPEEMERLTELKFILINRYGEDVDYSDEQKLRF